MQSFSAGLLGGALALAVLFHGHVAYAQTKLNWYDFTVTASELERRFAGRLENGTHGVSDPAMGEV